MDSNHKLFGSLLSPGCRSTQVPDVDCAGPKAHGNAIALRTDGDSTYDFGRSVTTKIPIAAMATTTDLEDRFSALCQLLVAKGLVTEAELVDAVRKLRPKSADSS